MPFLLKSITEAEGLLSNYIQDIAWDGQNRLWIATDKGLSMYDGYRLRHFTTQHGLSSSYVNKLLNHPISGCIILNTSDNTYYATDGRQLKKINLPALESVNAMGLLMDSALIFQGLNKQGQLVIYNLKDPMKPATTQPLLVADAKGAQNIVLLKVNELGYYDPLMLKNTLISWKGSTKLLKPEPARLERLVAANEQADSILITNNQLIWSKKGKWMINQNPLPGANYINAAFCMYEGKTAAMITAYGKGDLVILTSNGALHYFKHDDLQMPVINRLLPTANGNLLVATMGEGIKVLATSKGIQYFAGQKVDRVTGSGLFTWVSVNDDLYRIDNQTGLQMPAGIRVEQVTSLAANNQELMVTGLTEYQQFDISRFPLKRLMHRRFLGNGISSYAALPRKNYFLSTYNQGVLKYNEKNRLVDQWNKENGLMHDNIVEKIEPLNPGFAFTSYSEGVWIVDSSGYSKKIDKKSGLLSNAVYSVIRRQDTLFIGTEGGWHSYYNGKITRWGYAEGFAGKRAIYNFTDKRGRVFVLSEKNLMLREGLQLRTLNSWPVISSPVSTLRSVFFDTSTQQLWCASIAGLLRLNVMDILPDMQPVKPLLASALVQKEEIVIKSGILKLKPGQGSLVLHIGLNRMDLSDKAVVYYRLKGWNKDWEKLPDNFELQIPHLFPGKYPLEMVAVNRDGYKGPVIAMLTIQQLPPWYLHIISLVFYVLLLALGIWQGIRYLARRRVKQKMAVFLVAQQIQQERNRISHELHDNVGSQLTNIIAQLDYVETAMGQGRQTAALVKVEGLQAKARQAMGQLRESIWVLKEEAISLVVFIEKLNRYAQELFDEDSGVSFELDNRVEAEIMLGPWQAVNLLRILQEGCQNIQKHAAASKVGLVFDLKDQHLIISLADNGRGIDSEKQPAELGHGIGHMKHRAKAIDGNIQIRAGKAGGLTLEISLKLPAASVA